MNVASIDCRIPVILQYSGCVIKKKEIQLPSSILVTTSDSIHSINRPRSLGFAEARLGSWAVS
jgi:hypothetical protein